jgi:hypothetical protein
MKPCMSSCSCDSPKEFRISGEVINEASPDCEVRVRCKDCGGKVSYIPGAWIAELPGLELDDIRSGNVLREDEKLHITIDLT